MGKMIVIEGLDGSGKGTQASLLLENLKKSGRDAFAIDLPNYSDDSSALVRMYLRGEMGRHPGDVNAYAASTFFAVDRYASFKKFWGNEYDGGKIIVANRYTTSNACHQMTKLPEAEWDSFLDWLFDFEYRKLGIPAPDCVVFLDMPVEVSQKLLEKRYETTRAKRISTSLTLTIFITAALPQTMPATSSAGKESSAPKPADRKALRKFQGLFLKQSANIFKLSLINTFTFGGKHYGILFPGRRF